MEDSEKDSSKKESSQEGRVGNEEGGDNGAKQEDKSSGSDSLSQIDSPSEDYNADEVVATTVEKNLQRDSDSPGSQISPPVKKPVDAPVKEDKKEVKPEKEPAQQPAKVPEKTSNSSQDSFLKTWFRKTFRKWGDDHKKDKDVAKVKVKEDTKSIMHDPQTVDELPKDALKIVKGSDIPTEVIQKHFDVALNALHFQTKLKFKSIEDKRKAIKVSKQVSAPKSKQRPRPNIELIGKDDPKKLYKIQREEGKGGFGTVFKAINRKTNEKVAVKLLSHNSEKDQKFNLWEIAFLNFCSHPNIVKYIGSWACEKDKEIWMVMEFLEGGTLDRALRSYNFNEKQIAYVAREVLKGLEYLHSENLVHRDLKTANIMLSITGDVKLIDFGLCADISSGEKSSMVGSPFWIAPEMIQRVPYGTKVDIWSTGICLVELANGKPPNYKSSFKAMFTTGTVGYPNPLDKGEEWSTVFKDFLSKLLLMDPNQRPSATELLKHEFIGMADTPKNIQQLISNIFVLSAVLPF